MLQYLLKLTISLSIVYLFYQLFLRRLTFYNWNRWYLLIYSLVCFIIPFINVITILEKPALRESAFVNYIPAITQITPVNTTTWVGNNWWLLTAVVFVIGILVMIARLGVQYYSLYKMRSKAVLLYDNKVKLYHIDAPVMPFSFGRGIYVNKHQHNEHELKEIIRHEFIHVKQRHSLDIIWSELLCILNWYNPFAWLLRHDIRQNLEFIADQQVLQTGLDRKQYQYLLLKVIGVNSFSIANNFNFSSLKKRIAMMNKNQSARVHLIRFLFLFPLLVVVLLAFRNATQTHHEPLRSSITDTVPSVENVPPPPPPPPSVKVAVREVPKKPVAPAAPQKVIIDVVPNASAAPQSPVLIDLTPVPPPPPRDPAIQDCYNQKGYCVSVVDNRGEATVIVKDKNNKIVLAVSLNDWNKDKQYEDKYGEVPPRQIFLLPKTVIGNGLRLKTIKPATVRTDEKIVGDNTYYTTYKQKYLPMYSVTPDGNVAPVYIMRRGRPNAGSVAKSTPNPYVKMAETAKKENMIATNNRIVTVKIAKGSSMDKAGVTEIRPDLINLTPVGANEATAIKPRLAEVKKTTLILTPVAKPVGEAKEPAEAKPAAPTKEQ
ncbi:hypothetical protein A4H97_19660 [Niastella yeongjuensis]|uniref:Peptidase M56 domain-containing protein n=1 Tax=Niastella yeongjuensis TaxID=354355 RepID=A0A1V9FBP1_9BACT|nr:M56 family metallopeptidase [Niastella yeongjuensis]OQP55819.1 hypothetical protein A4H97_19660 [Niastella yeongjuensis]SEP47487.1 Signal transducer regulating beta-lactamase production, contains metallopeptidase domain [Niastella yeongjuensis]